MSNQLLQGRHLFISYARADGSAFAAKLHDDLEKAGFNTWLDVKDIPPGLDWNREITTAIRTAHAIIVIITEGAIFSDQVKAEWNDALDRYVPVIPLLFQDYELPPQLKLVNYIDFQLRPEKGLLELITYLEDMSTRHIQYIKTRLNEYNNSRNSAIYEKQIKSLERALETWSDFYEEQIKEEHEQNKRQLETLKKQKTRKTKTRPRKIPIVAGEPPPLGVIHFFHDRESESKTLQELLAKTSEKRVIDVVGTEGRGKTALTRKLFYDIEHGSLPNKNIKGILYLDLQAKKPDDPILDDLFTECGKFVSPRRQKRLQNAWKKIGDVPPKIRELLNTLFEDNQNDICVIILDNIESLLDKAGEIQNSGLKIFLKACFDTPHCPVRLIFTSQIPIAFTHEDSSLLKHEIYLSALPVSHAVAYLRDFMLKDKRFAVPESKLESIVKMLNLNPRAIKLFASIVAEEKDLPFDEIQNWLLSLSELEDISEEKLIRELTEKGYKEADLHAKRVLEALAVFNEAVPAVAIKFLLEPFMPGISIDPIIQRLVENHKLIEGNGGLDLDPTDRATIYGKLLTEDGQKI